MVAVRERPAGCKFFATYEITEVQAVRERTYRFRIESADIGSSGSAGLLVGPGVIHKVTDYVGLGGAFDRIWNWVRWPLVLLSLVVMLAASYYFLPNVKQRFRIISPGSVAAIIFWAVASVAFGFYVSHF